MPLPRCGAPARTVAVSAAAIALVACASVLGIEDRNLDTPGDASTSEGGGGPEGGTDSAPNADGPGTDAPANDAAGNDGPSGDGGGCADPCTMATGLNHPFQMTSDVNNVYWTEFGDDLGSANGYVKGCPLAGCGSGPKVYASALTNPRGIVSDGSSVYWGTATYSVVTGGIWSCPTSGCVGAPHQLATTGVPYGLAVDATYVYWANNDDGTVHRALKAGGGSDIVLYDAGSSLIPEAENCVLDNAFVYLTDYNGDVFRVPLGGGEPIAMAAGNGGGGWPVAIDSTNLYYGLGGQVVRLTKTTTDGGVPVAAGIPDPDGLAIDPGTSTIYWSNWGTGTGNDGTVGKATTDGGPASVLGASLVTPEDITVSGNYVFWLSSGVPDDAGITLPSTGVLMRNAK